MSLNKIDAYLDLQSIQYRNLSKLLEHTISQENNPKSNKLKRNSSQAFLDTSQEPYLNLLNFQINCSTKDIYNSSGYDQISKVLSSGDYSLSKNLEVRLTISNGLIEVYHFIKRKVLLFKLIISSEFLPFLLAQQSFFRDKMRSKNNVLIEAPVLKSFTIKLNPVIKTHVMSFNIGYSVSVKESIYISNPADFTKSLKELSNFILEPSLTPYQRVSGMDPDTVSSFQPSEAAFYNLITTHTESIAYDQKHPRLSLPHLNKTLLGFQNQTLQWMLDHEGVTYNPETKETIPIFILNDTQDLDDSLAHALDKISFGWNKYIHNQTRKEIWYNVFSGNVCTVEFALEFFKSLETPPPARALLSEEMGLGKTVEVISLISTNRRKHWKPFNQTITEVFSGDRLVSECKTTLIICPQTIIGQWKQEISENSSTLKVMIYEGITNYERDAESANTNISPSKMAQTLSEFDIVLVSYNTVTRELHRAVFKPTTRPKRRCTKRLKLGDISSMNDSEDSVKEYERIDYSSPLMLLEFWRVILDEVQMTAHMGSNAAKFARIIPRVHSWGVSGTLIKNDLNDLHSLLCFLRYHPIDFISQSNDSPWNAILNERSHFMFIRLFQSICLRHTKKMVSEQIRLPPQTRMMLRMPFTTVERDIYDNLFQQFLDQVGLDDSGNPARDEYDPNSVYYYMRQWLTRLRKICSHAQLGQQSFKRKNGKSRHGPDAASEDLVLGTLDDVLSGVLKKAYDDVVSDDRLYYSLKLKKGKVYEFLRDPIKAMHVFEELVPEIELKIENLKNNSNEKNQHQAKIRSWLELLHQTYFLLASSHFQQYRPMRPIPETFDDLENVQSDINEKIVVDVELLTPEQRVHYDIENNYYKRADNLLVSLLEEPLAKIQESTIKMIEKYDSFKTYTLRSRGKARNRLELGSYERFQQLITEGDVAADDKLFEVSPFSELNKKFSKLGSKPDANVLLFLDRIRNSIDQLNLQSHIINYWITKLIGLLKEPVAHYSTDDDNTGAEYGSSLINQELSHTYLAELQLVLEDRQNAIVPVENTQGKNLTTRGRTKSESELIAAGQPTNFELHLRLDKIRRRFMPDGKFNSKFSLKNIWIESTSFLSEHRSYIESDIVGTHLKSHEFMSLLSKSIKKEYDDQRRSTVTMRTKLFEILNDTFNSKIGYYKALQTESDALTNYSPAKPLKDHSSKSFVPHDAAQQDLVLLEKEMFDVERKVKVGTVRLSYLKSLIATGNGDSEDNSDEVQPESRLCIICRSSIVIGTLTSCGHRYCKECLSAWYKVNSTCPVCKKKLTTEDMYSFTFTKNELHGGLIKDSQNSQDENNNNEDDTENDLKRLKNNKNMEKDFFRIYKSIDDEILKDIMNIEIANNFGSKIDMITRQILYLRSIHKNVQILIFSQWPEFLKLLGRALRKNEIQFLPSVNIPSDNTSHPKSKKLKENRSLKGSADIDIFKRNPSITCFLLNAKAQAAGLTMTNASHVFLCEPLVNLPLELQAISRIHRIGQTHETTVWNFVIEGSVEESIAYMSTKKRLELVKQNKSRKTSNGTPAMYEDIGIDEDVLDVTELSKTLDGMVDKNDGEIISNDELWGSFFAAKSTHIIESVISGSKWF